MYYNFLFIQRKYIVSKNLIFNMIKKLKNKAKNLDILAYIFKNKKNIIIPEYFYFKKKEFYKKKIFFLKKISLFNKKKHTIVRSSATDEDQNNYSLAGKYNSLIIKKKTKYNLIEKELENYLKQFKNANDLIIIQKRIINVNSSGVLFSKDTNYDSPYYLLNFDTSGKTHLVTSGLKNIDQKKLIIYKNKKKTNKKFKHLLDSCNKLEKILKVDRLDIEFGLKNNKLYLFQVRKLSDNKGFLKDLKYSPGEFNDFLLNIKKKITKLQSFNPLISGNKSFFSNMADWNPAEMIGDKPKPLSVSLYKELITDKIWRDQRKSYGYQDVFPNSLLFTFAGSPYIDLRTDINSFLPDGLNKIDSEKIVNKYLKIIEINPSLHDKIEFDLVETCYSFNTEKRLNKLFLPNLVKKYLFFLKKTTQKIIDLNLIKSEQKKLQIFEDKIKLISKQKTSDIQKIYYYTQITKEFGTLPFAGIARCAFVSQRLLLDLKELNLITNNEFNNFFSSIKSVTKNLNNDYKLMCKKKISKNTFLDKYGHLRPSSYDINSLNYKEGFKIYFKNVKNNNNFKKINFTFSKSFEINNLLLKKFNISLKEFINFSSQSIYFREYAKLTFTKGINLIFASLIKLGKEINIKRNDLAFIDFNKILESYSSVEIIKLKKSLLSNILKNKFEYRIMQLIKLPDLILKADDIYEFYENESRPNFITLKKVIGDTIEINKKNLKKLKNKIVMIKNADPGYDYIFNYGIKGLITQYGGANSHMAIRCLEYSIPAAIGVGNTKFENLKKSKKIIIDCYKKEIINIK